MSDGITLIKGPEETIKAFNQRLEDVYLSDPITDVEAALVNGMPVLTLLTGTTYGDGDPEDDDDDNDEGGTDGIHTDGPPIGCCLIELRAETAEDAARSEKWSAKVMSRAAGSVVDVKYLTGQRYGWTKPPAEATSASSPDPKEEKERAQPWVYVAQSITYLLVIWEIDGEDADETGDGEPDGRSPKVLPPEEK